MVNFEPVQILQPVEKSMFSMFASTSIFFYPEMGGDWCFFRQNGSHLCLQHPSYCRGRVSAFVPFRAGGGGGRRWGVIVRSPVAGPIGFQVLLSRRPLLRGFLQ